MKKYHSNIFYAYVVKWGNQDADTKKQFGLSYRYFRVFLEKRKWRKALSFPLLLMGVCCLRVLVGTSFILSKSGNR